MPTRIIQILILLLFATSIAACEPPPVDDIDPDAEVATAVDQIATAIVIEENEIIPMRLTPESEGTQSPFSELVTQTPADVLMPAATPVVENTPLPTPTIVVTLPHTPTEAFTFPPAATQTLSPALPETGVLPSPTPDGPQVTTSGVVEGVPPEIDLAKQAWPLANGNYNNTRAAVNANIFVANVHTLGIAWSFDIPGGETIIPPAGSPIIAGDIVFYQDLQSNVFAFNISDGELVWQQEYDTPASGSNGPAIGYEKVFVQVGSDSLRALDINSGEELWNTALEGYGGAHQPYVFGGLVLTSTRQLERVPDLNNQSRTGWFYAIHHETGEIAWRLPAVEDGLWGDTEANARGGAWFSPAIDPQRGLSYWGTGKLVALPQENEVFTLSEPQNGNLYSYSVAALSLQSGELVWSTQLDPLPAFGHGLEAPPLLISREREDGDPQDIVIGAGRSGVILALDRDSGERIWEIRVGRQQNNDLVSFPIDRTIRIYPGVYGGIASPLAYADGTLYAAVNHLPSVFTAQAQGHNQDQGQVIDQEPTPLIPEISNDQLNGSSELIAIDAATGAVLWVVELPHMNFGGASVINNVLFTTTIDGAVFAFDRENGDELWAAQAPEGLLSLPAVSGDTIIMAALGGERPFVFALRLGLEANRTPAVTPTSTATPMMTPTQTPQLPLQPTPTIVMPSPTPMPSPSPTPLTTPAETEEPTPSPVLPSPTPNDTE
jgi:outer membrane protein assembly factor BamB